MTDEHGHAEDSLRRFTYGLWRIDVRHRPQYVRCRGPERRFSPERRRLAVHVKRLAVHVKG